MSLLIRVLNYFGSRFVKANKEFLDWGTKMAGGWDNCHRYPKEEEERLKKDDPNEMLYYTYPLNENSVVIDIGGLYGDWAARMYCLYSCYIEVYEPQLDLVEIAKRNFGNNPKVKIYPFGLSNKKGIMNLYGALWHGSLFPHEGVGIVNQVVIEKVSDVFKKYPHIDLLKMNVDGAEYDILPDLIENYDMNNIDIIHILFHNVVEGHTEKRDKIRVALSKTHNLEISYNWIFDRWVRKPKV
jgi:FkbM family methyltransferase